MAQATSATRTGDSGRRGQSYRPFAEGGGNRSHWNRFRFRWFSRSGQRTGGRFLLSGAIGGIAAARLFEGGCEEDRRAERAARVAPGRKGGLQPAARTIQGCLPLIRLRRTQRSILLPVCAD